MLAVERSQLELSTRGSSHSATPMDESAVNPDPVTVTVCPADRPVDGSTTIVGATGAGSAPPATPSTGGGPPSSAATAGAPTASTSTPAETASAEPTSRDLLARIGPAIIGWSGLVPRESNDKALWAR